MFSVLDTLSFELRAWGLGFRASPKQLEWRSDYVRKQQPGSGAFYLRPGTTRNLRLYTHYIIVPCTNQPH